MLFRTVSAGHASCFIKALEHGKRFLDDGEHVDALRVASAKGHARVVDELLARGAASVQDPYRKELDDYMSACPSVLQVIMYAQEKGYRILRPVNDALLLASRYGHASIVRRFASHGLLPRTPAFLNDMAITACVYGHLGVLEELFVDDLSSFSHLDKCYCLVCAAEKGHVGIARHLLESGADPSAFTKKERGFFHVSPLKAARRNGCRDVERLLVAWGARETAGTDDGWCIFQ